MPEARPEVLTTLGYIGQQPAFPPQKPEVTPKATPEALTERVIRQQLAGPGQTPNVTQETTQQRAPEPVPTNKHARDVSRQCFFDGKGSWKAFKLQFSRYATTYGWSESDCLD